MKAMTLHVCLVAALAVSTAPSAATVYKCGSTYSNVPCDNSKKLSVDDTRPIGSTSATDAEAERCTASAKVGLFDPESARVSRAFRSGGGLVEVAGQKIYAKTYYVVINAKNRFGAYVGDKVFTCYVSEATGRVLQVN